MNLFFLAHHTKMFIGTTKDNDMKICIKSTLPVYTLYDVRILRTYYVIHIHYIVQYQCCNVFNSKCYYWSSYNESKYKNISIVPHWICLTFSRQFSLCTLWILVYNNCIHVFSCFGTLILYYLVLWY